jgi:PAS domain S-box-containing protein
LIILQYVNNEQRDGLRLTGMLKKYIQRVNSRIAYKLTIWVIILGSLITLLATGIQLYLQYRHDLGGIEDYFNSISSMQLKGISQSVWIMDDAQILLQLDGLIKGEDITYAAVLMDAIPRWESGQYDDGRLISFSYPLLYSHKKAVENIGELQIVADLNGIYQRLWRQVVILLLTNAFKTFLFAGLILIFFQYSVTRHLEKLASHVVHMDFRKKVNPLDLGRKTSHVHDEFSQVVAMLNIMQRRGYHTFNALEKSENRLRHFLNSTEEGIFGIDLARNFTFANTTCLEKLGYEKMIQLIGKNIHKIVPSENGSGDDGADCLIARSIEEERTMMSDERKLILSDGTPFFASIRSYPIISGDKCTGALVFFNDISEQRELLREKNLLNQVVRQLPVMIIVSDEKGNVEYVNPGFEEISGYTLSEVFGKKPHFLGEYGNNKNIFKEIRETVSQGKKWQGRFNHKTKSGTYLFLDTVVSPVFDNSGNILNLIAVCLDVTQKIELQNQLNNAQKMEAVGRLSASFAHEFGNPLMGVRSVIDDIRKRTLLNKEDRRLLDLAYGECDRMKVLIRNFQQFHRNVSVEKEMFDLHEILDNVLFFYKKHLENNDVKLLKNYHEELPLIFVKRDQIAQVFLNLIINAVDAMSHTGGTLSITTDVEDEFVKIKMTDSGMGISDEEKELIFEPFFTTKPEVEGTGLGLSVSYGIVASHGGDIKVQSNALEGTTFTVYLPL